MTGGDAETPRGADDAALADAVDVAVVRPLRSEVLRPGQPAEASVMKDDDHPLSRHVALSIGGDVVSVGSVIPQPPPWAPAMTGAWRIRGMATKEGHRGRGLGASVLRALTDYAAASGGRLLWCHARIGATRFYERDGYVTRGDWFVTEGIEHIVMWRDL